MENAFDMVWDQSFEFGLRCQLDGLDQLIASRGSGWVAPPPVIRNDDGCLDAS
jgi:hypothetical protein